MGLLGTGALTPEEEEALRLELERQQAEAELQAYLESQRQQQVTAPPAEPQYPGIEKLALRPGEKPPLVIEDRPLVIEDEPEEAKPLEVAEAKPTKEPPKVIADPRPPLVIDEEPSRVDRTLLEMARLRRAEIDAMATDKTYSVERDQAAYDQKVLNAINSPEMWDASAEEMRELAVRMADEVYGGAVNVSWDKGRLKDIETYRAGGGTSPSSLLIEGAKETARSPEARPSFGESLAAGGATAQQLLWAGTEALAEVTGADALAKRAGQSREYYQSIREVMPKGIKLDEIKGVGDALQWASQTLGEQGVLMAAPMGGAVIGRVVGGSIGAYAGAFGPSWLLGAGEIQSANKTINPEQKAGLATLAGGTAIAALDSVLGTRVSGYLVKQFGRDGAEELAQRMLLMPATDRLKAAAGQVAKEAGKGVLTEAPTEALQTIFGEVATAYETGTPIQPGMLERALEAGFTGAFMGGVVGGSSAVVGEGVGAAQQGAPIRELERQQLPMPDVLGMFVPPQGVETIAGVPRSRVEELARSEVVLPALPIVISPDERPERPVTVSPTARPMDPEGNEQEFIIPSGPVTSRFGPRRTFRTANGEQASSNHAGIDIGLPSGAPVPAGADGVVVFAGEKGGYGNHIVIQHSDGTTSSYSHLSRISVEKGEHIAQGAAIGRVGSTGNATGPHLHLERRDAKGRPVNPMDGSVVATASVEDVHDDDTPWDVAQEEYDPPEDIDPEEFAVAYEEATGQRFEEEAPEAEAPEAPLASPVEQRPSPSQARGSAVIPRALRESPVAAPEDTALVAEAALDEAASRNPARIALAQLRAGKAAEIPDIGAAPAAQPLDVDWSQPQENEEPVFATDEAGVATNEVIGFVSPTGEMRSIGEPGSASPAAAPAATAQPTTAQPVGGLPIETPPAVEELASPVEMDLSTARNQPRTSGLRRAIFDALPKPSPQASQATTDGRLHGQQVALGMVEPLDVELMSKPFRTAYNIGVKEAEAALATATTEDFVSNSGVELATTPQIEDGSASNDATTVVEDEEAVDPIDTKLEEIEDKLFDFEVEGTKSDVKRYMLRLVREGILEQGDVDAVSYMMRDRDMTVDDMTYEVRTSIQEWADRQRRVPAARIVEAAPAQVAFEVAPDPENVALATRWRGLDLPTRQAITQRVTDALLPNIYKTLRATAETVGQIGGFMGESNPSITLSTVSHTKAFDLARAIGYALEQNSMVVLSERPLPGTSETGVVRVTIGDADPAAVYDRLWQIEVNGERPVGGYLMNGEDMLILNFSDVPTDELARLVDNATGGDYTVSAETAYAAFVERGEDDYGYRGEARTGPEGAQLDRLREQATGLREQGIREAEGQAQEQGVETDRGRAAALPLRGPVSDQQPRQQVTPRTEREAATRRREDYRAYKASILKQVHAMLQEMGLKGRVSVEVVDKLFEEADAAGSYNYQDRIIRLSALISHDIRQTARHEIVHWGRDNGLWTEEEWKILSNWARSQPGLMAWAKENYPEDTEELQIEEAVAEGFARWERGQLEPEGPVAKLLAKLRELILAIRDAFSTAGVSRGQLNAAAQLLADLESGAQAKRAEARAKKEDYGRQQWKHGLSREMLSGNISPEQHHFLRLNPGERFQSGWHGSPREDIEQFKLDFIGTGEGAQAFGWGLYFAQKQGVADWYRRKLTMGNVDPVDIVIQVDGVSMRSWVKDQLGDDHRLAGYEIADRLFDYLSMNKPYNGWLDAVHARIDNEISRWVAENRKDGNEQEATELLAIQKRIADVFAVLAKSRATVGQKQYPEKGKLYKVEVPENEDLLDMEKKLIDQSPKVKKALEKIRDELDWLGQLPSNEQKFGDFWGWDGYLFSRVVLPNVMYWAQPQDFRSISDALESALTNGHGPMATSIWLRDNGIPGSRYLDRDSRTGGEGTYNFVIFDDSAIELKARYRLVRVDGVNGPLGDPSIPNPGIWRRIHDQTMALIGSLAFADVDSTDNIVDAFKRKVTQKYQQIIKTQERATQQLGVERLAAGQNPMEMIAADERGYKLQFLTDNMLRPMATEMSQRGVSMEDLGLYLYARHAPARNARIAAINKEFRDPNNPGSGMKDSEAQAIMAQFSADGRLADLQELAKYIDAMIEMAQQERYSAGLLSADDIAAGFQPGDFYVPLRGNEEIEPEFEMDFGLAARKGGGFSVSGKEGHRMFGRASRADLEEIVGYTVTQAQQAIDRAYRNRVGQSMLAMFRAVPDSNFVSIDRVKRVAVWNKKKGQVEYQMQTRVTDPKEQARTLYVKEGGQVIKMTFNDKNPSAMRFIKAAKNLGMAELGPALRWFSLFTRLWSKANTQWNVEFILANATKDIQTGVLNASTLNRKGLRRAMIRNLLSLGPLIGAWKGSHHNAGAGFGSGHKWYEAFAEFEANGGKLNYGQIEPLEDALRNARAEIKKAGRSVFNPISMATGVLRWIDTANSAFENMTRLAAYKALRDGGVPAKQAAQAVRELTTNFQQHGEWGPKINAAYGFANASVIGGARFAKTVATKPQIAGGLIALGMMADMLNALLDEDEWDRYTEEDKHGNFMILLPAWTGFDLKFPAGYGLNAFVTVGRKFSELWRSKKNKDGTRMSALDAGADMMWGFINSFSPITGNSFFNVVSPTFFDPVVNIYQNHNNWGRPIMPPQSFRKEQQKPDSQLAFENTHVFWKTLATTMNNVGGGNEVVPGFTLLDMSPETYKHMVTETVGGAGRTFMRALTLAQKAATGEDVGPNDVPVVRRFAGNPYGAASAKDEQLSAFYDRMNTARVAIAQAKEMKARYGEDSPVYQEFRKANEPVINFYDKVKEADKRLRAYNAAENAAERGAVRAEGLKRRDRKAIFTATKIVVPAGRPLTKEEVAKVKAATKEKKERLAGQFNEQYLERVMGAEE